MHQGRKDVLAGPFPKDTGSNLPCDTNAAIFVFVSIPFYQFFFFILITLHNVFLVIIFNRDLLCMICLSLTHIEKVTR